MMEKSIPKKTFVVEMDRIDDSQLDKIISEVKETLNINSVMVTKNVVEVFNK